MNIGELENTKLWRRLNEGFNNSSDKEVAIKLAQNLKDICTSASDRMELFSSLHTQYTLHDETHLLRVTELMAKVMPENVLEILNPIEIALLILSAYFHDQGMVLSREEIELISSDPQFKEFSNRWEIEHPNFTKIKQRSTGKNLSPVEIHKCWCIEQDLLRAQLTDYLRRTHGMRSAQYVRSFDNNPLWEIVNTNFAHLVAKMCESHVEFAHDLTPSKGFYCDYSIGQYNVNMIYLSLVLRLADILDFDRDRTPDVLYREIDFTNEVSLQEWEKHRSVEGWKIDSVEVRFTMRCEHPVYQRAALEFMDWIDAELAAAYDVAKNLPTWKDYYFNLPLRCNRSRIKPKDDVYIYHDLEFSLSRNEIIKLLMMEELYNSPSLCVRELIQNSLDALRHRKALFRRNSGINWMSGKIQLVHAIDNDGYEILRCIDNGTGMDENIIKSFLTKVGRSYYQSYDFEQERTSFREAGCDFDPCSQFGIGLMSCFMIGDHITIHTRRDYGPKRGMGDSLIIEINGINGMVVIRKDPQDRDAGTTIEIRGRNKSLFYDKFNDIIQLINMIKGYALACEFPIEARCEIPGGELSLTILPGIEVPLTEMEMAGIKSINTFEQDFSEVDNNFAGLIRTSILVDEGGKLAISNNDAEWRKPSDKFHVPNLIFNGREVELNSFGTDQICMDGILICGEPGRQAELYNVTRYYSDITLGIGCFILDVRGPTKPSLTPARSPPRSGEDHFGRRNRSWVRLHHLMALAHGRLWENISHSFNSDLNYEIFWQLVSIYRAKILYMRSGKIWSHISVPIVFNNNEIEWRRISSLGKLSVVQNANSFRLMTNDGAEIKSYDKIDQWGSSRYGLDIDWLIKQVVIGISTVVLHNSQIFLEIREPASPDQSPWDFKLINGPISLPYVGLPEDTLAVQLPFSSVNRNHPLVREAIKGQYIQEQSELDIFSNLAVRRLSENIPLLVSFLDNLPQNGYGYSMCYLGRKYIMVDWSQYQKEFHPPYKVWSNDLGIIQINEHNLIKWAKSNINIG